ncbi:hypothetical protein J8273_6652 [Carpediemonas membranifera]|uniref:Uncharacterized protein n=1 Tax=Carpediemonas membranifera TaxID=201153 RepID=A0A8J6BW44_9EUKA|nr:hypothetical protein J8273_6652 [Carpediemonas membranifera]|eukprot:KAG9392061.1 hypothetical protein J8273_6652 [Carpediemonas membranifera]
MEQAWGDPKNRAQHMSVDAIQRQRSAKLQEPRVTIVKISPSSLTMLTQPMVSLLRAMGVDTEHLLDNMVCGERETMLGVIQLLGWAENAKKTTQVVDIVTFRELEWHVNGTVHGDGATPCWFVIT